MATGSTTVRIWDSFVRLFHWTVAIGFFVAYLTEDDVLSVHVWAGYVVGALVLVRIVWGFIGTRHARFTDFIYRPRTVLTYMRDLPRARSKRYLGHSPAGGTMVIAFLIALALTVFSGLVVYAENDRAGPLAPIYSSRTIIPQAADEDDDNRGRSRRRRGRGSDFEDIHEIMANLTLGLVFFHVFGVLLASFVHRENLAWAMITGRKRENE